MEDARELAEGVELLLIDIDRLTQRIHDEAVAALGGDLERLQAAKSEDIRERRRRRTMLNRTRATAQQKESTVGDDHDDASHGPSADDSESDPVVGLGRLFSPDEVEDGDDRGEESR